jgi:hypothetical protein
MLKRTAAILAAVLSLTTGVLAQEVKPDPQPARPPAPARPETPGQPTNIKLELTITDQTGPGEPGKRTVSMILADRQNGSIRSGGHVVSGGNRLPVTLNVDARPSLISNDNRILLELTLEYLPKPGSDNANSGEGRANLTERLGLVVTSGKPLVISHASDPTSDRKISVELTATILK